MKESQQLESSILSHLFGTQANGITSKVNMGKTEVNWEQFSPLLRVLLVTDGTVTKILEAYYWERVSVDQLVQETINTPQPIEALHVRVGEEILIREVRLRGNNTGNIYAFAASQIRLNLLPDTVREGLLAGQIGIGELILECGLETYREIQELGIILETTYSHLDNANNPSLQPVVYRDYRIIIAHQPTLFVTEKFPLQLYERFKYP
jgi:chorismate-pyruvate lyase